MASGPLSPLSGPHPSPDMHFPPCKSSPPGVSRHCAYRLPCTLGGWGSVGTEVRGCSHHTPSSTLWPGARNGLSCARNKTKLGSGSLSTLSPLSSPYKTGSQFWAEGHGAMSRVRQGCAWQFEMPFVMLWLLCSPGYSTVPSGELYGGQEILMVWKPSPVMAGQCDRDGLFLPGAVEVCAW